MHQRKMNNTDDLQSTSLTTVNGAVTFGGLPVDWLFGSGGRFHIDSDEKHQDILNCLSSHDKDHISLWELRELALSPRGLLCPSVRKRAWPLLLGCPTRIRLERTGHQHVMPSPQDLQALQQDILKTIWNVEEHLLASERFEEQLQKHRDMEQAEENKKKRVSFALPLLEVSETSQEGSRDADYVLGERQISPSSCTSKDSSIDSPTAASPTNSADTDGQSIGNNGLKSVLKKPLPEIQGFQRTLEKFQDTPSSPGQIVNNDDDLSTVDTNGTDTSFTVSCRLARWRDASVQEQKVLFNVLASVLRTSYSSSLDTYFEDEHFHYTSGLQNVAAILMINIESPSLTTCAFQQLAEYKFRDAMRPAASLTYPRLLQSVLPTLIQETDSDLYEHFSQSLDDDETPFYERLSSRLACWFTQDVMDLRVVSRLFDVLIVSHPLMPLYLTAASWSMQREYILEIPNVKNQLDRMVGETMNVEQIEDLIAKALEFMKQCPPNKLIQWAATEDRHANSFAALQANLPTYLTQDESLTEWALFQQVIQRDSSPLNQGCLSNGFTNVKKYPLAWTAVGAPKKKGGVSLRRKLLIVFCALCLLLCAGFLCDPFHQKSIPSEQTMKKSSPKVTHLAPWMDTPLLEQSHASNVLAQLHSDVPGKIVEKVRRETNQKSTEIKNFTKTIVHQSKAKREEIVSRIEHERTQIVGSLNRMCSSIGGTLAENGSKFQKGTERFVTSVTSGTKDKWTQGGETVRKVARDIGQASKKTFSVVKNGLEELNSKKITDTLNEAVARQSWTLQAEKHLTHEKNGWLKGWKNVGNDFEVLWWKNFEASDVDKLWW